MKICVLAAGLGTRNRYAERVPKGLLPIDNRPVLARLLDRCPRDAGIVVAVGHRADLYREYFAIAYPDRQVELVEVVPFEGPGSGPGRSLASCAPAIGGEPFLLLPTDAHLDEALPPPAESSWIGVSPVPGRGAEFCLAELDPAGAVRALHDKVAAPDPAWERSAFNGIAFVADPAAFFAGLGEGGASVVNGFRALARGRPGALRAARMESWRDTGTTEAYEAVLAAYPGQQLLKPDEVAYVAEGGDVLKFHVDPRVTRLKVERARLLRGYVPEITASTAHFFKYAHVPGGLLSEETSGERFERLLERAWSGIWRPLALPDAERARFRREQREFYREKTLARLDAYARRFGDGDREETINGRRVGPARSLVAAQDWDRLDDGIPVTFHGDFQPENIVLPEGGEREVYIDWRHESVDGNPLGDLYYDLAKLKHALVVAGQVVRRGGYRVARVGPDAWEVACEQPPHLAEFDRRLDRFVVGRGLDLDRVRRLSGLVFLNIAPLYREDYARFLHLWGRVTLADAT